MIEWDDADKKLQDEWEELRELFEKNPFDEMTTVAKLRELDRGSKGLEQLVRITDREGTSLIVCASKNNATSLVIDHLFKADEKLQAEWSELRGLFMSQNFGKEALEKLKELKCRKELEQLVLVTYEGRWSLLSCAIEKHAPSLVISLLIEADVGRRSILARDKDGNRPIHHAISAKASKKNIQLLLEADVEKETLTNRVVEDILNELPKYVTQDWMDLYLAKPLLTNILEPDVESSKHDSEEGGHRPPPQADTGEGDPGVAQSANSMKSDSAAKRDSMKGNPGSVPLDYFPMLASSVCKDEDLQTLVNENSAERHVVLVMLADFYANCALIVLFLEASDVYVTSASKESSIIGLYVVVGYLFLRQILTINAQKFQYLYDWWNFHDVCRMFLVLAAAISMQQTDMVADGSVENLLLFAGAFVFIGMVSFLRSTFLPFSSFVSGVLNIFRVLMPFFVVSGLVLVAFAYMYFINENQEEDFATLKDAFLTVYTYFVSGPDDTSKVLDVVFGVVIVIIFLNVVIAIVSEAWEEAAAHGAHAFWLYRIGFLAELWPLERFGKNHKSQRVVDLGNWVDSLGDYRVFYRVPYGKSLSKYIVTEQDDEEPYRSSHKDKGEGLESSLPKFKSFHTEWKDAKSNNTTRKEVLCRFLAWVAVFGVCIVLGILTFGVLWPKRIRMLLFGQNKTRSAGDSSETEELKAEIKSLKSEMQDQINNLKGDIQELKQEILDVLRDNVKMTAATPLKMKP